MQLKHVKKFGYTEGCRKRRAIREEDLSQPRLGHSEACNARTRGLAKDDEEFKVQAEAGAKRKTDTKGVPAARTGGNTGANSIESDADRRHAS